MPPSLIVFLFFFLFLFAIAIIIIIIIRKKKEWGFLVRGMHLSLLLVTIPQRIEEKEKETAVAEYLKTVEQFYSTLAGVREHSFLKRLFFSNPFFVFEIAVHHIGEEIYFYVASPRSLVGLVEKQILGFWPKAQIQQTTDYNVFNPSGVSVGSVAALTRAPIFPLKLYQEFASDPISAMTSVFTKLAKEEEGAAIQILIRPSKRSLKKIGEKTINFLQRGVGEKEALRGAYATTGVMGALRETTQEILKSPEARKREEEYYRKKGGGLYSMPQLSPLQQSQIAAISQKASSPLFDTIVRVVASAPTEVRAQQILQQLQSSFDQFNSPALNQIRWRKFSRKALQNLFYRFSFRIFHEGEIMLLSSAELASLFHFPPMTLLTPAIKWLKTKQAPPPVNIPKEGLIIGKNIFRGEETLIPILKNDRGRHFYIVGQTGTGKSVLLQEMIRQDIAAGEGVCLIDPHGDLAENVLSLIPPARLEDVIYFNPADLERPLGLNMLEYDPRFPESKTLVVNELLEIFEKLYNLKALGFGGPVFEQYMRNALLLVMEDPESGNTLLEVPRVLADTTFRKYKLSRCRNIVVKNFWELEAEKAGGEAALANMVPYITSKMNIFIANDLVRPIIAQQVSSFNFREVMDQGKILIINLSKGRLGDINSYLLGMIIVGKLLIASFSRADIPEEQRRHFYCYIDEFHNVTTRTITAALAEARKYRFNLILSHQFIGQLDEETRKAIFGNIGSILAFRVGPDDAKYLKTEFEPVFDENDLINLDNYNAALKLLINGETSKPFNIVTFPPTRGNPEAKELVQNFSRAKYGADRAIIEAEIYRRLREHPS